ncbi:MAG: aminotransferase class I/II-fold pyridoxal phosphate-dependent enzyme [Bacteroidales bacterium]|nr:aminotransferase class I/II-fold pyridoxal phosphate-dependent enzyme [Bacteroidales bacterium]
MINKLNKLEQISKKLEGSVALRKDWNQAVLNYAGDFLQKVNETNTFNLFEEDDILKINFDISENSVPVNDVIQQIKQDIDKPGLNPASGGHLAYIPGGGVFPTALGDYLAAVFNKYAGIYYAGPGVVKLENTLIRWMCEIIGFPKNALGNLTSGGSVATLIAVATARDVKKITSKNVTKSVIYITEQAHHSVDKAIRISGLNEALIKYIPMDGNFRMNTVNLKKQVHNDKLTGLNPFLIISSAGTTDTGAIDPMEKISEIAKENNMWHHADAAYGGFFILLENYKNKFKGIEMADSVTIDPHKGLFLAYGTGAVLIKDVNALNQTHRYQANYMQDVVEAVAEPSPADLSPELTKHFRGLRMWMPLRLFGLKPFKAALEEKILLTHYFYNEIQKLGFETGPFPDLSVMIYRYVPKNKDANSFNLMLIDEVKKDGRVFLSSTKINGVIWLRLAVLSFRTHLRTIDTALEVLNSLIMKFS